MEKDVLTYIGGYIIKLPQCDIGIAMESEWIDVVSEGGRRKPSQALVAKMMALEQFYLVGLLNGRQGRFQAYRPFSVKGAQ